MHLRPDFMRYIWYSDLDSLSHSLCLSLSLSLSLPLPLPFLPPSLPPSLFLVIKAIDGDIKN